MQRWLFPMVTIMPLHFRTDDVATILREWRRRGEMTQREAADVIGIPLWTLRAWEQRRTHPQPDLPTRIALEALVTEMGLMQPDDVTCYRFAGATT